MHIDNIQKLEIEDIRNIGSEQTPKEEKYE
jgi:hypothetical protein